MVDLKKILKDAALHSASFSTPFLPTSQLKITRKKIFFFEMHFKFLFVNSSVHRCQLHHFIYFETTIVENKRTLGISVIILLLYLLCSDYSTQWLNTPGVSVLFWRFRNTLATNVKAYPVAYHTLNKLKFRINQHQWKVV